MTDAVMIAVIAAVSGTVTTALGVVSTVLAKKADERAGRNEEHQKTTKEAIVTLAKETNGLKDALVTAAGKAGFEEGLKAGKEEVSKTQ